MDKQERLRVALDGRSLEDESSHGISRYTFELLNNLPKNRKVILFVLTSKRQNIKKNKALLPFTSIEIKSKFLSLYEQVEIPYLLLRHKIDLFHSPSFLVPILCPCDFILTLHDLNHLVLWRNYSFIHKLYYKLVIGWQITKSFKVLTVSNFTKNEIIKAYGSSKKDKIIVIPNGVSYPRISSQDLEKSRTSLNLPESFCFALSNGKKHKNIKLLLDVYKKLETKTPLVIAGNLSNDIKIEKYQKTKKIIFLSSLSEKELFSCYTLTKLFIFPSLYEGFGLPPLEALSSRAPVLSSNASSLPEVLGPHVSYFNPQSRHSLTRALQKILKTKALKKSQKNKASTYAKNFTWKKLSKTIADLYDSYFSTMK